MEYIEVKGLKSHWRWGMGLYWKRCVLCNYIDKTQQTPEICPGCKSIMIQPEPTRGGRQ